MIVKSKPDEINVQAKIEYLFPLPLCRVELPDEVMTRMEIETTKILHDENREDHAANLAGKIHEGEQIAIPKVGYMKSFIETGILQACQGYIKCSTVLDGHSIKMWETFDMTFQKAWLVSQYAGDYNPIHTHSGILSGIIYIKVPPQINASSEPDGWLTFHNNREYDAFTLRFQMTQNRLPKRGDMYIFPAWLGHSVSPFRGEGERRSMAFNVHAYPTGKKATGYNKKVWDEREKK